MGRTLHYSLTKEKGGLTRTDKLAMIRIADKYNSGKLKELWSCENYYFTPYNYYPNWSKFKEDEKKDAWDIINKRWEELAAKGAGDIEIYETLYKEDLILFHHSPDNNEITGFTKVQGNEFNALMVYMALIELSLVVPDSIIKLSDEGYFLYTDVLIKNGKARPLLSEIKDNLRYYYELLVSRNNKFRSKINTYDLPEGIIKDLSLTKHSYEEKIVFEWINEKLKNMNELYKNIKNHIKPEYHCIYNIENDWYDPDLLCRPVNIENFRNMKCNASTLMAGFYGEHWNLTDKDPESESYRAIGKMKKMLGIDDNPNIQMEILPKINRP